jgi:transcriptional regulator with XRE-family HTH domain
MAVFSFGLCPRLYGQGLYQKPDYPSNGMFRRLIKKWDKMPRFWASFPEFRLRNHKILQEQDTMGKVYLSYGECVNRPTSFIFACEARLTEQIRGIKEVLARNLKINRLKLGLTQEKLSEKAEISTHYLAMIELAKKFPSADMLERLATALEVEPHELFYMPSIAENALERLQETVVTNIERVVAKAIQETLADECCKGKGYYSA